MVLSHLGEARGEHATVQEKLYILEVQLNPHAQQVRDGQGCCNTFNPIFEIPQTQIEDGRVFKFNSLEINSMAVWEIGNTDQTNNVFDNNTSTRYSWMRGYLWSFKTVVDLNKLETDQQPTLISVIIALGYCGTQCINILPENTRTKVNNLLNRLDRERFTTCRWLDLSRVQHFGVKDQRYLCGAPRFNRKMDNIGYRISPPSTRGGDMEIRSTRPKRISTWTPHEARLRSTRATSDQ